MVVSRVPKRARFAYSPPEPDSLQDRLGKHVSRHQLLLQQYPSLPDFLRARRGVSNLSTLEGPTYPTLPLHPATSLVRHLATTGWLPSPNDYPPWTLAQRDHAVQRGPHQSAHLYRDFLREELAAALLQQDNSFNTRPPARPSAHHTIWLIESGQTKGGLDVVQLQ